MHQRAIEEYDDDDDVQMSLRSEINHPSRGRRSRGEGEHWPLQDTLIDWPRDIALIRQLSLESSWKLFSASALKRESLSTSG